MSEKKLSDDASGGMGLIDAMTKIGGPSHEELRRPFQKTVDQHDRDFKRQIERAARKLNLNGGK
jgi:hypothetical protein